MNFETFGPFRIWLDDRGNIPDDLGKFWEQVDNERAGLSSAKGCYLFTIRTSGGSSLSTWYVGKTDKSFSRECFQPHKRVIYAKSLSRYKRAVPYLLLIPRLTDHGALYKGNGERSTVFLEDYLIGVGLQANPQLENKRDTKLYRELRLLGILNSRGSKPNKATAELKRALRL